MTALLAALWPLFALIVGGYALRLKGFPGDAFWPAAERLNYFILFPALLFSSLATAPLDNPRCRAWPWRCCWAWASAGPSCSWPAA